MSQDHLSDALPILTADEIQIILSETMEASHAAKTRCKRQALLRDAAMLKTAWLTGIGVAEVCALDLKAVNLEGKTIRLAGSPYRKSRSVPMADDLVTALKEWIGQRKSGPLFPVSSGEPISPRQFRDRFKGMRKRAGLDRPLSPRSTRGGFSASLLSNGTPVADLKEMLGSQLTAAAVRSLKAVPARMRTAVNGL